MDSLVLHDCLALALAGKLSFPETVKRMNAIGVERYRADLVRMEKTHYGYAGEAYAEHFELQQAPEIPSSFSPELVRHALTRVQTGEIQYAEFLRRIMSAGVAEYGVWLEGRKAIYSGRNGDFYIEPFPNTKE